MSGEFSGEYPVINNGEQQEQPVYNQGEENKPTELSLEAITEPVVSEFITPNKEQLQYAEDLDREMTTPEAPALTPEQQKNKEILDGLINKYPHAFNMGITKGGIEYAIINLPEEEVKGGFITSKEGKDIRYGFISYGRSEPNNINVVLSRKGITTTLGLRSREKRVRDLSNYDLSRIFDRDSDSGEIVTLPEKNGDGEAIINEFYTRGYDNTTPESLETLKKLLNAAEAQGLKDIEDQKNRSAASILELL